MFTPDMDTIGKRSLRLPLQQSMQLPYSERGKGTCPGLCVTTTELGGAQLDWHWCCMVEARGAPDGHAASSAVAARLAE